MVNAFLFENEGTFLAISLYSNPVVLKLCVATPRCVVSIFQGRRGIIWLKANESRLYCVKRTLIVDSFFTFF